MWGAEHTSFRQAGTSLTDWHGKNRTSTLLPSSSERGEKKKSYRPLSISIGHPLALLPPSSPSFFPPMCNQPNPRVGLEKKKRLQYTPICVSGVTGRVSEQSASQRERMCSLLIQHINKAEQTLRALITRWGSLAVAAPLIRFRALRLYYRPPPPPPRWVNWWVSGYRGMERERRGIMAEVDWLRAKVRELSIYGGKILFLFFYHQRESTE